MDAQSDTATYSILDFRRICIDKPTKPGLAARRCAPELKPLGGDDPSLIPLKRRVKDQKVGKNLGVTQYLPCRTGAEPAAARRVA